jgi:hypothetical protein
MSKTVARILLVVLIIFIILGCLIFIPVSEEMTVSSVQWRTVIKCYTYTQHHEDEWGMAEGLTLVTCERLSPVTHTM